MYTHYCKQITKQWKTIRNATTKNVLNPIETNGKCLTKIPSNIYHLYLFSDGRRNTNFYYRFRGNQY